MHTANFTVYRDTRALYIYIYITIIVIPIKHFNIADVFTTTTVDKKLCS